MLFLIIADLGIVLAASAATCTPATSGGSAPADWPSYCWLDFSTYNDTQARSTGGQSFSYTLSDGSVFSFVATVTASTTPGLKGTTAPSWTGAAVGNTAFLGISGSPILYQATGAATDTVTFSKIALTPPPGVTTASTYDFVAADGESTNGGESLSFTTNGGVWVVLDKVPPISGGNYPTTSTSNSGLTFTETGQDGTVGGYIVGSTNATQVSATMIGTGLQGAMFALRFASLSLNAQVNGRTYAADQFKYSISLTSSGTVLATAATSGTGTGPYTLTTSFVTTPQSFTLSETMAAGSVSALAGYNTRLTCTNSNSASSTSLPSNVTATSYVLSGLAYGDSIICMFSDVANAPPPPDHYAVTTPGTAVNCSPAAVTVTAHNNSHQAFATTDTIKLSTSTGHGDWTLTTGLGTFVAGSSNTGTATYTYSPADFGSVVLALRDTYPETVTINVTDGSITAKSGSATSSEDLPLTFAPSGFIFTNGTNVATTIGTQVSGVTSTQSLALQAVRTDTTTGACTAVFAQGTTVNIGLTYQCNNPSTCVAGQTFTVTNNSTSTSIVANPGTGIATYTSVPLKFSTANGEAPITINYSDAGQITLAAKYTIPLGSGVGSTNTMTGAGTFVVQPYTLKLSNIKATSSGIANPAASSATGTVFVGAGQPFTATVTALNYQGNATPNFGQELSPATVALTPALVLPSGGHNPAVGGSFGSFAGGAATGSAFSWAEVGIMSLTPGVANYLNSNSAVTGTNSGNIGRFIPNNFATSLNTPVFGTACAAGSFTYIGQPFVYTVAPVITATAQALGNITTQNYTGAFMRLSNTSLTGRAYTPNPSSNPLSLTGLPSTSVDPAIADQGSGSVLLTYSSGSGINFTRSTPVPQFAANIALSQNVIDLDGVTAANPVTFGASGGIAFSSGSNQLYGRIMIRNSVGSELLDLPALMQSQYYYYQTQQFTTNPSDVCTSATIALSNYQMNLKSGQTCVRDSGSPGASGIGCAAAAATGQRYLAPAAAGNFNLILAAPGAGNNGSLTVTATVPSWLQYLWSTSSGTNSNPSAVATFGQFPGPPARVYEREVY